MKLKLFSGTNVEENMKLKLFSETNIKENTI